MPYITHAATAEELRQVLISDIRYRIENLQRQREAFGRGMAGKARFDARINELELMLRHWMETEIISSRKPNFPSKPQNERKNSHVTEK